MTLTTPEQYRFHQLKRNEIKTLASAIKDCKEKATLFIESRWGKRLMRRRARQLAKESRVKRGLSNSAGKRKRKLKNKDIKNEQGLKKRLDKLANKNTKYRTTLLKEQKVLLEERDQVFGQAKNELEERLGKYTQQRMERAIAYMEKTVDFDFYSSSLLQTCFIVIASYLLYSKHPKQVIFNVKKYFNSFTSFITLL